MREREINEEERKRILERVKEIYARCNEEQRDSFVRYLKEQLVYTINEKLLREILKDIDRSPQPYPRRVGRVV